MSRIQGKVGRFVAEKEHATAMREAAVDRIPRPLSKWRARIFALFVSAALIISLFAVLSVVTNPSDQNSNPPQFTLPRTQYYNERDQISFNFETTIGASVGDVNSIAMGDLDNDGDLEIVTVSYNDLTVWRSTADPWQLWDAYTAGDFAWETGTCVAVGDLDNDGWLDIVAADDDTNVWCWRNDGTPFESWGLPNRITTTSVIQPFAVVDLVIVDLDHDAWPDVIVVDNSTDGINVYMCQNDHSPFSGLWSGMADGYVPASAATCIDAADINLDGWPDLVVGHASGKVVGWENNYDPFGTIMTKHLLCDLSVRSASVNDLALGDLDNDCDIDIVTADNREEIYAWENQGGSGSWNPMTGLSISGLLGYNATALRIADLDNDGWPDVFAGTDEEGKMLTVENDHSCWADTWDLTLMGYGGEGRVLSVGVGDIDKDGDLDSISGHYDFSGGGGTVLSWQNALMHRNMPFYSEGYVDYGNPANDGTLGDLDNDGDLDGIIARNLNATAGELVLIRNTEPNPEMYSLEVGSTLSSVAVADLDADGDLEIIGGVSGALYLWYNIGDPWTGGWPRVTIETDAAFGYANIRTGDLDMDGYIDIVVGGTGGSANLLRVYRNDGTPLDGGWTMNAAAQMFPGVVLAIELADVDKNGTLDILATGNSGSSNKIVVYENDWTPFSGYWPKHDIGTTTPSGSYPYSIVAADLDNDCDVDLAVAETYGGNRVFVFENDGTPYDALWSWAIANTFFDDLWSISAADFDLDGDIDLVVGGDADEADEVQVLINNGAPFSSVWDLHPVGAPNNRVIVVVCGDMDNDCDSDIIALTMIPSRLYLYWNIGAQVTETAVDVAPSSIDADTSAAVVRIRVHPNGIASDNPAVVRYWCFRIYAGDGITPLTPDEMNETFRSFSLYRDNGDLVWSNVSDNVVTDYQELHGNVVVMAISGLDDDRIVAQLSDAYFFFVVELQWGANIPGFRVYFDPTEWNSSWMANLLEIETIGKCLSVQITSAVMTKAITVIVIPEFASLLVPILAMIAVVLAMRGIRGARKTS
ncbi:MAG: VCBS repeat-containing protein [Thermoplasmata archaeon]